MMIFFRPILSDSRPKRTKNGVPMRSESAISRYAVWNGTLRVMIRKNRA